MEPFLSYYSNSLAWWIHLFRIWCALLHIRAVKSNMNNCCSVHAATMLLSSKIEHGRLYLFFFYMWFRNALFLPFNWSCHQVLWQRLVDIAISELMDVATPDLTWIMPCLVEIWEASLFFLTAVSKACMCVLSDRLKNERKTQRFQLY
jgi:hypothetical protein